MSLSADQLAFTLDALRPGPSPDRTSRHALIGFALFVVFYGLLFGTCKLNGFVMNEMSHQKLKKYTDHQTDIYEFHALALEFFNVDHSGDF